MSNSSNQIEFRKLLDQVLDIQDRSEYGGEVPERITELVHNVSKIDIVADKPDDAVMDAKVLSVSTNVLSHCVDDIDANLYAFNANLYTQNVLAYVRVENKERAPYDDWCRLHPLTDPCQLHTTSFEYMLGTYTPGEREPKKSREKTVKQAEHKGPAVKPINVSAGEKQEDGIEDSLSTIMAILRTMYKQNGEKPVCYFKLMLDPESFGATVENLYHISFLVKDGLISLTLDSDGLPVVAPVFKSKTNPSGSQQATKNNQCIISLDMEEWKELVRDFNITQASIPRRDMKLQQTSSKSKQQ